MISLSVDGKWLAWFTFKMLRRPAQNRCLIKKLKRTAWKRSCYWGRLETWLAMGKWVLIQIADVLPRESQHPKLQESRCGSLVEMGSMMLQLFWSLDRNSLWDLNGYYDRVRYVPSRKMICLSCAPWHESKHLPPHLISISLFWPLSTISLGSNCCWSLCSNLGHSSIQN